MNRLAVQHFVRAEVWTAPECAGGTRLAVLSAAATVSAAVTLDGDARLTIVVPLDSADAAVLIERRVVRVVGTGADEVDEWRILSAATRLTAGTLTIVAVPIGTDLANGTLVGTTDADGVRTYDFEGVGLTVAQHLTTYVLPALAEIGVGWVSLGLIEPTGPVDVVYHGDSPWGAARKVAAAAQCELRLRRVGATGYALDVLRQVGADAALVDVRESKNLVDLTRDRSSAAQHTRMFAFGAALDGVRATIARAVWVVTAVDGTTVSLADPNGGAGPIGFDDQLAPNTAAPDGLAIGGAYLRTTAGALTAILASDAVAQTVTVASAAGIAEGDLVQVRADAAGSDLAWLDHPAQIATAGIKIGTVDASEIAGTHNRIPNPVARAWPEGDALPAGWATIGTATATRNTSILYTQVGGQSVRVTGAADGDGVAFPLAPLAPTAAAPYVSGYASLWVVSGQVRVELVLIAADATEYAMPIAPAVATNTILGQWESLGVSGLNAAVLPDGKGAAVAARLQVVQMGATPAVWYQDGGQVTDTASHAALIEGSGGTRLWQIANTELAASGAPPDTLTVPLVALPRVDAARWGMEAGVVLGGTLRVVSPSAGVGTRIRVVGIERTYQPTRDEKVTLAAVRPPSVLEAFSRGTAGGPVVTTPPPVTTVPTGPGGAGGGGVAVDTQAVVVSDAGLVLSAVPAARTALPGNRRVWQNASAFDRVRILADIPDAATAPGIKLSAWWSADGGVTKRPMAADVSTDPIDGAAPTAELALAAAGALRGDMVSLGRACVGDVLCGVDTIGGDAAGGVTVGAVHLQWLRALPDGYRPPPVVVAPESCAVVPAGAVWAEDFSSYADTAALNAAAAAATTGDLLKGYTHIDTAGRAAVIDPAVTFCGHQTLRGDYLNSASSNGWLINSALPEVVADCWCRMRYKLTANLTGITTTPNLVLFLFQLAGDEGASAALYIETNNALDLVTYSADGSGTLTSTIAGGAESIVTGDWVEVIGRLRVSGGAFTVSAWRGPVGGPYTAVTPVTRATADTGVTRFQTSQTNIHVTDAMATYCGSIEVHDGAVNDDPYGVGGASEPVVSDNRNINMLEDPDFDGPPYATYGWKTRAGLGGAVTYGQSAGPSGFNTRAALVTGSDKWPAQRPLGCVAGQRYTVSVYVQVLAGQVRLDIDNLSGAGTDSDVAWAADGAWHRMTYTFLWNGGGALEPKPVVVVRGLSSGASFYAAAAQLEPGTAASAWSRT